ncbi:kinesin heavy chain, putative [Babesia ovata]|uniref:Kinesin heavy chain, putative n=1 Tax=Babesia ovata TaxID=189622 RepID=A0A2H6KGR1_9APIC|nr:kinesin heavy chain, putative [Babesia ovata]GBE62190.1 kinesin heavy chain, putative [Babesia ovata]
MTQFTFCGRRNLAFVFCIYMNAINGVFTAVPGGDDASDCGSQSYPHIATYAMRGDICRRLEGLESLHTNATRFHNELGIIAESISKSKDPPATKEALQEQCGELLKDMQHIIDVTRDYAELGRMLRETRQIYIEFKTGVLTGGRSAELNKAMTSLDKRFGCNHHLIPGISEYERLTHLFRIGDAEAFVDRHRVTEPSTPEPAVDVGGKSKATDTESVVAATGVSDAPEVVPPVEEGDEMVWEPINESAVLTTLFNIQVDLKKIEDILRGPLIDDTSSVDAIKSVFSYFHRFDVNAQNFVEFVSDQMTRIESLMYMFKRQDLISEQLKTMDLSSPTAVELVAQLKRINLELEKYASFKHIFHPKELEREVPRILHGLQRLLENRKNIKHNVSSNIKPRTPTKPKIPATVKVSRGLDTPQDSEAAPNNILTTNYKQLPSGVEAIGIRVIQTTMAIALMATL